MRWCSVFVKCTSTTEIYAYWHTLSLHGALPISRGCRTARNGACGGCRLRACRCRRVRSRDRACACGQSMEKTSPESSSRPRVRLPRLLVGNRLPAPAQRHAIALLEVALGGHVGEARGLEQRAHRRALLPAVLDQQPAATTQVRGRVGCDAADRIQAVGRSEEHTSELQSLMRISYAVFYLKQNIFFHCM